MLTDWFTIGATIFNFLVLVVLLKFFLYGRVIKAMDAREEKIASRLEEAARKRKQADAKAQEFEDKEEEVEQKRREILDQAKQDAEETRKKLTKDAREEADELSRKWKEALRDEQEQFVQRLSEEAASQVCGMTRHILEQMAHAQLEDQVIASFIENASNLSEEEWQQLTESADEGPVKPVVRTAFPLDDEQRKKLEELIHDHLGEDAETGFQQDDEVICGIELRVGGHALGWSLAERLESMEQDMRENIVGPEAGTAGTAADADDEQEEEDAGAKENGEGEDQ